MSLTYSKGSFPFLISTNAALITPTAPANVIMPLSSLCKAFWLGKSFDYNINVVGTIPSDGTTTGAVTFIGSGTHDISSMLGPGDTPITGVTVLPAVRVNRDGGYRPIYLPSDIPSNDAELISYVSTTIFTYVDGSGRPPITQISDEAAAFNWFAGFGVDGSALVIKDSGVFKTFANIELPSQNAIYDLVTGDTTQLPQAITVTLVVDGESVSIPVFNNNAATGTTATGTIEFNFNNFWTP